MEEIQCPKCNRYQKPFVGECPFCITSRKISEKLKGRKQSAKHVKKRIASLKRTYLNRQEP